MCNFNCNCNRSFWERK